ncbi:MAG TPA: DUF4175 family protein [Vicinamibacterales bacterium]|nr:DUF4175 family protein [Vicinamibacterales bacterium]
MADRAAELRAVLAHVRARWARRAFLRAWTLGAATAAAMLLVGLLAIWLVANEGLPLVFVVSTAGLVAGVALSFAFLPLRRQPTDRQIARFIEEQAGDLDEVIVTAVSKLDGQGDRQSTPVLDLLVADAIRAARGVDTHRIVTHDSMMRAAIGGAIGTIVFLIAFVVFAPSASRAVDVAGSYLFPAFYGIEVSPGSIKVREGQPVTVTARIPGTDGGMVPSITVGRGEAARSARMSPGASTGEFVITLNNITTSFPYMVTAGSARSDEFEVQVIQPVKVSRIDVKYDYAPGLGLEPHTEEDGGDIFAPSGTRVHLTITADKPVANGRLSLSDGRQVALSGHSQVFSAELRVTKDGSYRVALNDVDGLSNDGGTEYFIRMLNDRPPDVRILRPAGDKQVSPLEEVPIEARADDDYGIRSLELVIKSAAGKEKVVPLGPAERGTVATGQHTVFLEDLNVKPGDMVTYHARAVDVGRGRRPMESRSDIFFLEVKPYEEEFVASESQAGAMGQQQTGLEDLIAQQKDIMAATWKLDARSRRGGAGAQSAQDIKSVAQAQTTLKGKAEEIAQQMTGAMAAQRRRLGPQGRGLTRPGDEPLPRAIDAMGRAAGELDRLRVAAALPHEEQALAELLKAAAEIRRRMVAMQQAQGGGGNGNRNQADLSTLFDQELRKRQQTNYEQQSTTTDNAAQNQEEKDPLAEIRDLARRQESLSKQQRDLAANKEQMTPDEVKRQLERLTRDQEELRRQADELAKQQGSQSAQGAQGGQSGNSQRLRDVAEQMRQAAGELRNQDPGQASARGAKAGEALRGIEQQMQGARPEERRRAMGDLQLEARQLAEAERRLGNEASRTAAGAAGEDARRRLAGEQERLADRAQRLGESVKQMASNGEAGERQAMTAAARELDKQNVAGRMRESAQSMRQGQPNQQQGGADADDIARALDRVAEQLGSATGNRDAETARLSEQLSQAQELRDRVSRLQRSMEELQKQGAQSAPGNQGTQGAPSPPGSAGRDGASGQQGGTAGGRGGNDVDRLQRDVEQQMREAQKLAEAMQRDNPGMQKGGTTPEQWQRSVSAPGTEAFKQDFANWDSLKKNLLVALEQTESKLSDQLRARETRERLNAGRHDAVSDSYRTLVDRYYQSLSAPRSQKTPAPPR